MGRMYLNHEADLERLPLIDTFDTRIASEEGLKSPTSVSIWPQSHFPKAGQGQESIFKAKADAFV